MIYYIYCSMSMWMWIMFCIWICIYVRKIMKIGAYKIVSVSICTQITSYICWINTKLILWFIYMSTGKKAANSMNKYERRTVFFDWISVEITYNAFLLSNYFCFKSTILVINKLLFVFCLPFLWKPVSFLLGSDLSINWILSIKFSWCYCHKKELYCFH